MIRFVSVNALVVALGNGLLRLSISWSFYLVLCNFIYSCFIRLSCWKFGLLLISLFLIIVNGIKSEKVVAAKRAMIL